jgi:preprotein translocase subunit SecF
MSRVLFDWLLSCKPDVRFSMLRFFSRPQIPFIQQSRIAVVVSLMLVIASLVLFAVKGKSMLSVDFTGGTLLSYNYSTQIPVSELELALRNDGLESKVTYKVSASANDSRKVEILLREGAEKKFAAGSDSIGEELRSKLNGKFPQLELRDCSVTQVGGLVGKEMTRNAIISLVLAFLGMIAYVSVRYEFNYAVSGILALVHDVILSLGVYVLLGREMSLPVVAATYMALAVLPPPSSVLMQAFTGFPMNCSICSRAML